MKLKKALRASLVVVIVLAGLGLAAKIVLMDVSSVPEKSDSGIDFAAIDLMAGEEPGSLPTAINRVMILKGIFPAKYVIAGGAPADYHNAMPSYQVVYTDTTVVIDPVCGEETMRKKSARGAEYQFYTVGFDAAQRAMRKAQLIVLTHEHYDHAGGIPDSPYRDEILPRTVVTAEQADSKWIADAGFTPAMLKAVRHLSYEKYHRLLPGMVLVKTPGHTPGHQMIYVRLRDGKRYLLAGDIAWNTDNIRRLTGRPLLVSLLLGEDRDLSANQIRWIHDEIFRRPDRNVRLVVFHDYDALEALVKAGDVGDGFQL
ncbi:MAG: MBL fold metallo-hydrolase [Spirochaetes bacterium]|nr:MBL fold metallo-hydrolase [Spirochaetota bacterium]